MRCTIWCTVWRHNVVHNVVRGAMLDAIPELIANAGTVLSVAQAARAVAAGAQFVVAPGLNPEVGS